MEKKLFTVAESAVYLGISRSLLYIYVMNRQIPSIKVGRARRIAVTALDSWIEQRQTEAQSDQDLE